MPPMPEPSANYLYLKGLIDDRGGPVSSDLLQGHIEAHLPIDMNEWRQLFNNCVTSIGGLDPGIQTMVKELQDTTVYPPLLTRGDVDKAVNKILASEQPAMVATPDSWIEQVDKWELSMLTSRLHDLIFTKRRTVWEAEQLKAMLETRLRAVHPDRYPVIIPPRESLPFPPPPPPYWGDLSPRTPPPARNHTRPVATRYSGSASTPHQAPPAPYFAGLATAANSGSGPAPPAPYHPGLVIAANSGSGPAPPVPYHPGLVTTGNSGSYAAPPAPYYTGQLIMGSFHPASPAHPAPYHTGQVTTGNSHSHPAPPAPPPGSARPPDN